MTTPQRERVVKGIVEVIDFAECLDDIIQVVVDQLDPDDVFSEGQLKTWAENNGYVEAE